MILCLISPWFFTEIFKPKRGVLYVKAMTNMALFLHLKKGPTLPTSASEGVSIATN